MNDWKDFIDQETKENYYIELKKFVDEQYETKTIYPKKSNVYRAFVLTEYQNTNVVLLGQDPYHGANQAHGLSFSVENPNAKYPPSLQNIFKELESDLEVIRTNRNLSDWAEQGILMLNTVLTVEAANAGSHRGYGWEVFTDKVIARINDKEQQVIFILWGADAGKKVPLITNPKHKIFRSVHPSPLSAHRGFFGSKPFSTVNNWLAEAGKPPINW